MGGTSGCRRRGGGLEFVVRDAVWAAGGVETFGELLAALDAGGAPTKFPFADWPGMAVSVVA